MKFSVLINVFLIMLLSVNVSAYSINSTRIGLDDYNSYSCSPQDAHLTARSFTNQLSTIEEYVCVDFESKQIKVIDNMTFIKESTKKEVNFITTSQGMFVNLGFDSKTSTYINIYDLRRRNVSKSISGKYSKNRIRLQIPQDERNKYNVSVNTSKEIIKTNLYTRKNA